METVFCASWSAFKAQIAIYIDYQIDFFFFAYCIMYICLPQNTGLIWSWQHTLLELKPQFSG